MKLPRAGREYYRLQIITVPQINAWDASFDNGSTWVTGTYDNVAAQMTWLVRGPLYVPPGGDVAVSSLISADCKPLVRATSNPEVIIRSAPEIVLVQGA
jgi:hypothetical protein